MGADIHGPFVERPWYDDKYQSVAEFDVWRDYILFGLMAGVRQDTALYEPRGWPDDASWQAQDHVQERGDDCHSHSWLTVPEFEQVAKAYGGPSQAITSMLALLRAEKDARILFCFDN